MLWRCHKRHGFAKVALISAVCSKNFTPTPPSVVNMLSSYVSLLCTSNRSLKKIIASAGCCLAWRSTAHFESAEHITQSPSDSKRVECTLPLFKTI